MSRPETAKTSQASKGLAGFLFLSPWRQNPDRRQPFLLSLHAAGANRKGVNVTAPQMRARGDALPCGMIGIWRKLVSRRHIQQRGRKIDRTGDAFELGLDAFTAADPGVDAGRLHDVSGRQGHDDTSNRVDAFDSDHPNEVSMRGASVTTPLPSGLIIRARLANAMTSSPATVRMLNTSPSCAVIPGGWPASLKVESTS